MSMLCFTEHDDNCNLTKACGNERIENKQVKDTPEFNVKAKWLGLKCNKEYRKYERINECVGLAGRKNELSALLNEYRNEKRTCAMSFDQKMIRFRKYGGIARCINHSCDPYYVICQCECKTKLKEYRLSMQSKSKDKKNNFLCLFLKRRNTGTHVGVEEA